MSQLSLDLFYYLSEIISCHQTLLSLCLVSKEFNEIFTPRLYSQVQLQDCPTSLVERLANHPRARLVRNFHLGRRIGNPDEEYEFNGDDKRRRALVKCWDNMLGLESLTIAEYLHQWDIPPMSGERPFEKAFKKLAAQGRLRDLSITAFGEGIPYDLLLPPFRNLRKLVLHEIARFWADSSNPGLGQLAKVLIASPNLEVLGLSYPRFLWELGMMTEREGLSSLIQQYDILREKAGIPLLRLKELDLGYRFMPEKNETHRDGHSGRISNLTDLSTLRILRLDNITHENDPVALPFNFIELYDATNLIHLSATFMAKEIVELISHLRSQGKPLTMSSLETKGSLFTLPYLKESSISGSQINTSGIAIAILSDWRSLIKTNESIFYNGSTLPEYSHLETFTCRLGHRSQYEVLDKAIRYDLPNLHTLMIPYGPWQNSAPWTPEPELMIKTSIKKPEKQQLSIHTILTRLSSSSKRYEKPKKNRFGYLELMQMLAEEILRISWKAWKLREGEMKGRRLKYVGLGYRVYTWMACASGEVVNGRNWKIVELSHAEATGFEAVRRLLRDTREG